MINDRHVIVNYHYVEDPSPRFPGIFPCPVAEFDRQTRFLSENYRIVSAVEVFEASQADSQDKLAAITFDDGLKGQYQNSIPILRKYGARATFFPITGTLEGRLPTAHKVQALLSRLSIDQAIDFFNEYMEENYPDFQGSYYIPKDRRLTDKRMHEGIGSANFKEVMIMLREDIKDRFLSHAFKKFLLDEKSLAGKIFMSEKEISNLKNQGMIVGNHSHNHYAFNVINPDAMRAEIRLAAKRLGEILGDLPAIFSYPHGRNNEASREVLKSEGFKHAFTIEKRAVAAGDDSLKIPRYDALNLL